MHVEVFSDLRLVGGTALALHIGHRESVDIDLFGEIDFEAQENDIKISEKFEFLKKSKHIKISVDFRNCRRRLFSFGFIKGYWRDEIECDYRTWHKERFY